MSAHPRVLLLGAHGQVGTELRRTFADWSPTALDRSDADLSRPETLRAVMRAARPQVILNAAAYTAVDRAESEPDLADRVNHQSVRIVAEEAERLGALLVHYSTDYVFDGTKTEPWVETDPTAPLNVYGATKLAGERAIQNTCSKHLILRTSWVYSAHGHNFLRTMLRLGRERDVVRVVNDQWGAPTSAGALAEATGHVVARLSLENDWAAPEKWAGTYHATCGGRTSWCGFAQAIFARSRSMGKTGWATVDAISTDQHPTAARRPVNSVLSNERLAQKLGVQLPHWENALDLVIAEAG